MSKSYGRLAVLRGLDLDVQPGEICGLIGRNGAGKTTLVSIVSGLCAADGGSVRIDGLDAFRDMRRIRTRLGVAPQDMGIYPTLSVHANLEFFGGLNGVRGTALRRRIAAVAEELSLEDLLSRCAGTLSGGQKRRLHTALALLHTSSLLFLDEPTVGADVVSRGELLAAVRRLACEGCAVVYATHHLAEIEEMGASVAILEGGVIQERGDLASVVARHGHSTVELEFAGEAPVLDGWEHDGAFIRRAAPDPARAAAAAIASLDGAATRLRNVRIVPTNLQSAYLAVTGRAPDPIVSEMELVDVVA
ncbi:MAG: ABC transporter ATP-binding protein [Gemmatimonadaceae bacterium]|nr:ABC transporter ATP-binding protein [Gemmatimonadaceae bacterium]